MRGTADFRWQTEHRIASLSRDSKIFTGHMAVEGLLA